MDPPSGGDATCTSTSSTRQPALTANEEKRATPSNTTVMLQMNPQLMGQVCPGLWVGELTSIQEIRQQPEPTSSWNSLLPATTTNTTTQWTVISLLKSEKLTHFVHATLDAIQNEAAQESDDVKRQHQHHRHQQHQNDDDFASISSSHRVVIQRHVEWEIADQSESDFLSPRLQEILTIMEDALGENNNNDQIQETSTSPPSLYSCCLVHCALGISRSVALCAAYLLWKRHVDTLQAALTQIRAVRPQAAPNLGFIACLRALEQCHGNVALARQRMAVMRGKNID
jgi:predicted protein tyrosine phosphatase